MQYSLACRNTSDTFNTTTKVARLSICSRGWMILSTQLQLLNITCRLPSLSAVEDLVSVKFFISWISVENCCCLSWPLSTCVLQDVWSNGKKVNKHQTSVWYFNILLRDVYCYFSRILPQKTYLFFPPRNCSFFLLDVDWIHHICFWMPRLFPDDATWRLISHKSQIIASVFVLQDECWIWNTVYWGYEGMCRVEVLFS